MRGGRAHSSKAGGAHTGAIRRAALRRPASRAGFEFTARMMRRDWQFRRQIVPMMVLPVVGFASIFAAGWRHDRSPGRFTEVHIVPHVFGAVLFFVCVFLPYGSDYQAARMFLLAPSQAFAGFARGIYALLWIIAAVPHIILLFPLAWLWGFWHAGLFVAYSLAAASVYLGTRVAPRRGRAIFAPGGPLARGRGIAHGDGRRLGHGYSRRPAVYSRVSFACVGHGGCCRRGSGGLVPNAQFAGGARGIHPISFEFAFSGVRRLLSGD